MIFTLKIEFGLWSSYTVSFQSFERLTFYFLQIFLVFMWTQEYKRMTNKRSLTRVCLYVQPRWLNLEQPWFCLLLKRNAQRKKNLAQSCPTADHFLVALPSFLPILVSCLQSLVLCQQKHPNIKHPKMLRKKKNCLTSKNFNL